MVWRWGGCLVAVSDVGAGMVGGGRFWFWRWGGCWCMFMALALGWLLVAVSGFGAGVVVGGYF
eukprot:2582147-Pyramimonas_sp.AAC.1